MAERYIGRNGRCCYGTMHNAGHPVPEEAFDVLIQKCRDLKLTVVDLFSHGTIEGKEVVGVLCTDNVDGTRSLPYFHVKSYRVKGDPLPHMNVMECINKQGPTLPKKANADEDIAPQPVTEDDCRWWIDRYYSKIAELAAHPNEDRMFTIPKEMLVGASLDAVKAHLDKSSYYCGTWIQEDGSICVQLRQAELTDDDIDAFVEQENHLYYDD